MLSKVINELKTNLFLQLTLIIITLGLLLGTTSWMEQKPKTQVQKIQPPPTITAQLKLTAPPSANVNREFNVKIKLESKGNFVNTVIANLNYPPDKLEFKGIDLKDSFLKIWFDKRAENGKVLLTGALPSPGFRGQGEVASITFKAKETGRAKIGFDRLSKVYENKTNQNILGGTFGATIEILPSP